MRIVAVAMLVLFAASASAETRACRADETLATVSFPTRLPDAAVSALVREHEVTPHAVFMWSQGIYGTYRPPVAERSRAVEGARASAVQNFERALDGVGYRARTFVGRYSRDDVQRDQRAAAEARSLLARQVQHDSILRHARSNAPLIYAIAVCATAPELARLQAHDGVTVTLSRNGRAAARPERPVTMTNEFRAPEVDRLTAAEAYRRLQNLGR